MTTIKVYGKISFSEKLYALCKTSEASVYMLSLFTAPRLSSRLLHYAETKLHSDSMKFIEV